MFEATDFVIIILILSLFLPCLMIGKKQKERFIGLKEKL
jgi:hypothetical protein